jgi:hypothetical protein
VEALKVAELGALKALLGLPFFDYADYITKLLS